MPLLRVYLTTVLAVALLAGCASARQPTLAPVPAPVPAGSTLKLTLASGDGVVHAAGNGRITLLGADSSFLFVSGVTRGRADTIAYAALYRIEVRDGSYPVGEAMAKGAFATAAVELLSVLAITKGKALSNGDDRNATLAVSGIAFGFGGLMGAIVSRERWRIVHAPLSVAPPRDTTAR